MISRKDSAELNSVKFACMVALILHHTNVDHLIPPPDDLVGASYNQLVAIERMVDFPFLSILFVISGYLFFMRRDDAQPTVVEWLRHDWTYKLRRRVMSLLIPYVIWCVVSIFYRQVVKGIVVPSYPVEFAKLFWDCGTGHPVGMALWFMKSLMVFSVLAPVYYVLIRTLKHFILPVVLFLTVTDIPIDYPWFSVYLLLGSYLAVCRVDIGQALRLVDWRLASVSYILLKWIVIVYPDVSSPLIGDLTMWMAFTALWGLFARVSVPHWLVATNTFLYFCHPYFTGVRNIYFRFADSSSLFSVTMVWLATAATVLCICVILYHGLARIAPRILKVLVGNR